MTPERWQQVAGVFQSAMEQEPGTRGAYLASVCGDDAELRREVESLLAQPSTPGLIDRPLTGAAAHAFGVATNLAPGTTVGPYRIVGLIGEGGMGPGLPRAGCEAAPAPPPRRRWTSWN